MMKTKRILSVLLAFLLILPSICMSVTAEEAGAFKVGDNYYVTLTEAATAVESGGTIYLVKDYTYPETTAQTVSPIKAYTIDGQGYKITANNSARIYNFGEPGSDTPGVVVTLKNITMEQSGTGFFFQVNKNSKVILGEGAVLNYGFTSVPGNSAVIMQYKSTFDLNGGTINAGSKVAANTATNSFFRLNEDASTLNIIDGELVGNCYDVYQVAANATINLNKEGILDSYSESGTPITTININYACADKTAVITNIFHKTFGIGNIYTASLLKAESNVSANGTVDMLKDYTPVTSTFDTLGATVNYTLDGHGHTIRANANNRIFNIGGTAGTALTFKNVNFVQNNVNQVFNVLQGKTVILDNGTALSYADNKINTTPAIIIQNSATLRIKDGASIANTYVTEKKDTASLIKLNEANATVVLEGGTLTTKGYTVWMAATGGTLTVEKDGILTDDSIYLQNGTVNKPYVKVAKIGSVEYTTLADAIAAVQDNETILLLGNMTLAATMDLNVAKTFTIDGQGYKLTGPTTLMVLACVGDNANVTFKNVTLELPQSDSSILEVKGTATLDNGTILKNTGDTVGGNSWQNGIKLTKDGAALNILTGATVDVKGTAIKSDGYSSNTVVDGGSVTTPHRMFVGNGSGKTINLTIKSGSIVSSLTSDYFMNGFGSTLNFNILGGTVIYGGNAISNVNINYQGGTVKELSKVVLNVPTEDLFGDASVAIRLPEEATLANSGLAFGTKLDKESFDAIKGTVTTGTLITVKDWLNSDEKLTLDFMKNHADKNLVNINNTNNGWYNQDTADEDGYYLYYGSLVNMFTEIFDVEFVAVPYVTVAASGFGSFTFYGTEQTATLSAVAGAISTTDGAGNQLGTASQRAILDTFCGR